MLHLIQHFSTQHNPSDQHHFNGLEKSESFGLNFTSVQSTSHTAVSVTEWNEGMNSTNQQQKRLPQHFERAMRVTEQRSYANLTSSFDVPTVGRVSVPRKNQLRSTKSFHGDASNIITDVSVRSSQGGDREKSSVSQSATLTNGYTLLRQPQSSNRKIMERQRNKVLKPLCVTKNQNNISKVQELGQEFCSAILPDASTASYRLTHDVSFDEGSRYRGAAAIPFVSFKNGDDAREGTLRRKTSYPSVDDQRPTTSNTRLDLLGDKSNKRPPTSHVQTLTLKEPISYTFLRSDEKRSSSRGISPQSSSPTYYSSSSPNGVPVLKTSKDARSNWNNKYGDLSISGGNFCGSSPIQPGGRLDSSTLNSITVNSTYTQKMTFRTLSREKNVASANRPRFSSKGRSELPYSSPMKDCAYADPCVGASPSFHQRLNELSLLEAETIKFEKNRKFKRKTKSDKDS